jgi:hypothetical protein
VARVHRVEVDPVKDNHFFGRQRGGNELPRTDFTFLTGPTQARVGKFAAEKAKGYSRKPLPLRRRVARFLSRHLLAILALALFIAAAFAYRQVRAMRPECERLDVQSEREDCRKLPRYEK